MSRDAVETLARRKLVYDIVKEACYVVPLLQTSELERLLEPATGQEKTTNAEKLYDLMHVHGSLSVGISETLTQACYVDLEKVSRLLDNLYTKIRELRERKNIQESITVFRSAEWRAYLHSELENIFCEKNLQNSSLDAETLDKLVDNTQKRLSNYAPCLLVATKYGLRKGGEDCFVWKFMRNTGYKKAELFWSIQSQSTVYHFTGAKTPVLWEKLRANEYEKKELVGRTIATLFDESAGLSLNRCAKLARRL